jgi:hypothetical protein
MFIFISEKAFLLCFTKYQNETEIFKDTLKMSMLVSSALSLNPHFLSLVNSSRYYCLENICTIMAIIVQIFSK